MNNYPAGVTAIDIDNWRTGRAPKKIYRVRVNGQILPDWFREGAAISKARELGAEVVRHTLSKGWITEWRPECKLQKTA